MLVISFTVCWFTRQLGVVLAIFILQAMIYRELIAVGDAGAGAGAGGEGVGVGAGRANATLLTRFLPWFWFAVAALWMYGRTLHPYFVSALDAVPVERGRRGLPLGWFWAGGVESGGGGVESGGTGSGGATSAGGGGIDIGIDIGTGIDSDSDIHAPTNSSPLVDVAKWALRRHIPIVFALYCVGIVLFVVSLQRRRAFRIQFAQLAYCHVALLAVVGQSTLLAANAYAGLYWVLLPTGLVVANDSFAYFAGFFCGRTPLIRLSPKKTVEGFIGGALGATVFALAFTYFAEKADFFDWKYLLACPVESGLGLEIRRCVVEEVGGGVFRPLPLTHASRPLMGLVARSLIGNDFAGFIHASPAALHACVMGLFASFVSPFGGFLASGFKRAFRIKDFSSVLPGHGGFTVSGEPGSEWNDPKPSKCEAGSSDTW